MIRNAIRSIIRSAIRPFVNSGLGKKATTTNNQFPYTLPFEVA